VNELEFEPEGEERVERWLEESRFVLGQVIPEILEERETPPGTVPVGAWRQIRRDTGALRQELNSLRVEIHSLRDELVDVRQSAHAIEERLEHVASRRGMLLVGVAGIAVAVVGAMLLWPGLANRSEPTRTAAPAPAPPESPAPAVVEPATPPAPVAVRREPEPRRPARRQESPRAAVESVSRAGPAPVTRNAIHNFRAVSLSGGEMEVTVDYDYAGTHGAKDVFLHAAALQDESWSSRVPGTSFPEAKISPGSGSVKISITKLPNSGNATSTRVKLCMVSIPTRSAFACETFAYAKDWE
jgi:hypothetical protein